MHYEPMKTTKIHIEYSFNMLKEMVFTYQFFIQIITFNKKLYYDFYHVLQKQNYSEDFFQPKTLLLRFCQSLLFLVSRL